MSENPVIWSVIRHHQDPLESTEPLSLAKGLIVLPRGLTGEVQNRYIVYPLLNGE
jgi:hypothetical protein